MNRLFIKLCLDEDINVLIADLLRARGFKATTTQEARQLGNSDEEQLAYAVSQQKTLFTHNRIDFEKIAEQYFIEGKTHCGIIIGFRRPPYEITRRLSVLLNNIATDEMKDQLRYI